MGIIALYNSVNFVAEIIMNDWKNKPPVVTVGAMSFFTFIIGNRVTFNIKNHKIATSYHNLNII